ncbi:hypothetical protein HDE_14002 [Halotydeus destructor]|nr:hypothetical protein HDE_14002 [Halotydeus destructor]
MASPDCSLFSWFDFACCLYGHGYRPAVSVAPETSDRDTEGSKVVRAGHLSPACSKASTPIYWVNWAFFGLSIGFNLYLVAHKLSYMTKSETLFLISLVSQSLSFVFVQIKALRNRSFLSEQILQAKRLISPSDNDRFSLRCQCYFVAFVTIVIIEFASVTLNGDNKVLRKSSHSDHSVLNVILLLLESVYFNGLFVVSIFFYTLLGTLIDLVCHIVSLTTIVNIGTFEAFVTSFRDLRDMRFRAYLLSTNIQSSASFLPFLWITLLFLEITGRLMNSVKIHTDLNALALYWSSVLVKFFVLFYACCRSDTTVSREKQRRLALQGTILSISGHKAANIVFRAKGLMFETSKYPVAISYAGGFFKFNRKTLLSFAGAIISISVMLLSMFDISKL